MPASTFEQILKKHTENGTEGRFTEETHNDAFSIYKTDDDKRLVFGWASVSIKVDGEQLEDRQKDIIDPEDLEEAAYEYVLNFRDTGEEHIKSMRKKGKLVESCVFTAEKQKAMGIPEGTLPIAWWIGFKIEDDDAWARVKNGTYKMFSIEGKANRIPVEKSVETVERVAKTFDEVLKFNPYHDSRGRFSTANGYAYFTTATKDPQKQHWADMAIAREKQKQPPAPPAPPAPPPPPPKPTKNYDKLGFADYDDADFHQLHSGRQYYQQQKLTATQQKAVNSYLESNPEPGSLYSHSQNMNYQMANGQKLTGKYKQTHDGLMDSMHNLGYNVELTRYDHADMVNGMLKTLGAGTNYERMSASAIKKALVGQTVNENKFLSASYNDFKNAPASSRQVFDSRAVKINYKAKADVQGMMPGKGPGGDLGEIILAPTNGTANRGGKIVDVRLTGQMVRRKGTQLYNQPRIEIDIEI